MPEPTPHDIRPARRRDLAHLPAFEDAKGASTIFVAAPGPDAPPVGFAHVRILDGHAHLEQVSVHPDHRRSGVGTALVEHVSEALSARGHGSVTALAPADMPPSTPLLARVGFVAVPADEPRPAHLVAMSASDERVLMRRVLRRHRTHAELEAFLPMLDAAPKDEGTLRLVVRRPAVGAREVLDVGVLDLHTGLAGDTWIERGSRRTDDGSAHPDMQLNIMSHSMVEFLARDPERVPLAGDQLYIDLDLSHDNLPAWSKLHIGGEGGAVIEVTDQPHNGCGKFIARFGKDAMTFVNGPEGKPRRLRGLCARVVTPGVIRAGDKVRVERP